MNVLERINALSQSNIDNASHGVIFAVTAIPTKGVDGQQGIGGIGETWFADALGLQLNRTVLGFGKALREYANKNAGHQLTEAEFEGWRANLATTKSVKQEHDIDKMSWDMAQRESNLTGCSVIAGKAVGYLKDHYLSTENKPAVVTIGVSTDDLEATKRTWKRQHPEVERDPNETELKITAQSRYGRRQTERVNYSNAYPDLIPNYSRESILETINYTFDNTPKRTRKTMFEIAHNFLNELVCEYPSIAPAVLSTLTQ